MKVHDLKDRLIRKAGTSTCKYRVAAIGIDHRGVAIASATNAPRLDKYGGSLHAEMRVMRRSPRSLERIVIIRLGATGDILPIHPCQACARQANQLGIRIETIGAYHG